MQKKNLSFLLIIILLVGLCYTNVNSSNFKIKIGESSSNFVGLESEIITNWTFGISYEWFINQSISISAELFHIEKGGLLRDKKVGVEFWDFYVVQDINCSIKYFEIPILLNYYLPLYKNLKLQIFGGFAYAYSYSDDTKLNTKNMIMMNELSEEELNNLILDYYWNFDPGPRYESESSTIDINIGTGLVYKRFFLHFRYSQNLKGQIETVYDLYLGERVRTMSILLGYTL